MKTVAQGADIRKVHGYDLYRNSQIYDNGKREYIGTTMCF